MPIREGNFRQTILIAIKEWNELPEWLREEEVAT